MNFDKLFNKQKRDAQTSKQSDVETSEEETSTSSKEPEDPPGSQTPEPSHTETSSNLNTPTSEQVHTQMSNISTAKHLKAQTSKAKSKNKDYIRTTFYLPRKTHQDLKIASINEQEDMSEIVTRLIEEWLET